MERLKKIGESIRTQDNRITDAPLFIVQKKVRDFGYDSEYSDDYAWLDTDNGYDEASEEEAGKLDNDDANFESTRPWIKVYYKDRWEFVTACFTEQGCKDYISKNGHNLGETRIYADGSFRNEEYRCVRDFLMSI